jgi:hypothetical protein
VHYVGAAWTDPPSAVVTERLYDDVFALAVLKADVNVWRTYPPPPATHISNSVDLAQGASESTAKKRRVDFEREDHAVVIPNRIRPHVQAQRVDTSPTQSAVVLQELISRLQL